MYVISLLLPGDARCCQVKSAELTVTFGLNSLEDFVSGPWGWVHSLPAQVAALAYGHEVVVQHLAGLGEQVLQAVGSWGPAGLYSDPGAHLFQILLVLHQLDDDPGGLSARGIIIVRAL
jgi:hypothetical protein